MTTTPASADTPPDALKACPLPCPFCQSELARSPLGPWYHNGMGCVLTGYGVKEDEIEHWNTRATPTIEARPAAPAVAEVEHIAKLIALAGLGTIDGNPRTRPNDKWTQAEWEKRILECVPGAIEDRCRQLAHEIAALAQQPASDAALVEALQAMLDNYGPHETLLRTIQFPDSHPITKARNALAKRALQHPRPSGEREKALREALPEVIEADERLSQAMLDNTSCEITDEGNGLCGAKTTVVCAYNDLRIVLGFLDEVRAALTNQPEAKS